MDNIAQRAQIIVLKRALIKEKEINRKLELAGKPLDMLVFPFNKAEYFGSQPLQQTLLKLLDFITATEKDLLDLDSTFALNIDEPLEKVIVCKQRLLSLLPAVYSSLPSFAFYYQNLFILINGLARQLGCGQYHCEKYQRNIIYLIFQSGEEFLHMENLVNLKKFFKKEIGISGTTHHHSTIGINMLNHIGSSGYTQNHITKDKEVENASTQTELIEEVSTSSSLNLSAQRAVQYSEIVQQLYARINYST